MVHISENLPWEKPIEFNIPSTPSKRNSEVGKWEFEQMTFVSDARPSYTFFLLLPIVPFLFLKIGMVVVSSMTALY